MTPQTVGICRILKSDLTRWVAEHGREINVDGTRHAVAGDSAGGNMVAAVWLPVAI
jgi:hypothetical protein